jgi:hypothetical protein
MHIPYTTKTGLKIGSRYQENGITMPMEDLDMNQLQEALLSTPEYRKAKKLHNIFVKLSIVLFIAILLVPFFIVGK